MADENDDEGSWWRFMMTENIAYERLNDDNNQ